MSERVVINGEPCELVTDFAALRAGMLVYVTGCELCSPTVSHRGILLMSEFGPVTDAIGDTRLEQRWTFEPVTVCDCQCFTEEDVDDGVVYRVVDGLEAPSQQETVRKPETVNG